MKPETPEVSLGVCFQEILKQFRDVLNIVESPSLGFVKVPAKVGELTAQALWVILFHIESKWCLAKIYIRCEILERSLTLRIINNGGEFDEKMQWSISLLSEWAVRRGWDPRFLTFEYGEQDEGWFVALSISLHD